MNNNKGNVDPCFGTNAFNEPKYKTETETLANNILALLFGKPGFFPSMPELGVNIQDTLYQFFDDIDTSILKAKIISQCEAFSDAIDTGELDIVKSVYHGEPLLMIVLPVQVNNNSSNMIVGISKDANDKMIYNFTMNNTNN